MAYALFEIVLVVGAILWRIWLAPKPLYWTQWLILAYICGSFASHALVRVETAFLPQLLRDIGFLPKGFMGLRLVALTVVINALLLCSIAWLFNKSALTGFSATEWLARTWHYLLWGLTQQAMFSWFVRRLEELLQNDAAIAVAAGATFALFHLPNWPLVALTLLNGTISGYVLHRTRDIYSMAAGHAAIGAAGLMLLPTMWARHYVVGPRYWTWMP